MKTKMLKELSAVWQPFQSRAKRSSHADPLAKRSSHADPRAKRSSRSGYHGRNARVSVRHTIHIFRRAPVAILVPDLFALFSRSAAVQFVRCLVSVFCFCSRSPAWFQRTAADWAALSSSLLHPWSISSLAVSAQFNVIQRNQYKCTILLD